MESEPCPAGHEWVVAITDDVVVDVPKVRGGARNRLLRHPHPLRTLEDCQLRAPDVMSFNKGSIPGRIHRASREYASRIVCRARSGTVNDVSIASSEPSAIGSMLREYLEVQLSEVEQTFKTVPAEALVADS